MSEICVCAEPLNERAKFPCGHELCLQCTLKKRVLMKDKGCPYCRTQAAMVYVVSSASTGVENAHQKFQPGDLKVETRQIASRLRHILSYACPECDAENTSYKSLKNHIQDVHKKTLCDVCTRHEYVFSDEYTLIKPNKMKEHLKSKHIYCKYCNNYHYGTTEFTRHCRQEHIGCVVCERVDPGKPLYFQTYEQLQKHYSDSHYMCMVPSCLENKHIVFGTEMELQKHMVESHRGLLDNVRKSQTVSLERLTKDTNPEEGNESSHLNGEEQIKRYRARLELATNHDSSKIERLEAANQTFMTKNVPVQIFVATYESVLESTPASEVTALLVAFNKSYGYQLSQRNATQLSYVLQQRTQGEDIQGTVESNPLVPSTSAKQQARPATATVQKYNWGLAVPRSGGIGDVTQLPRLGSHATGNEQPRQVPSWRASVSSKPPTSAFRNLPTLTKKNPHPERQTSVPLRDSRPSLSQSLGLPSRTVVSPYSNSSNSFAGPSSSSTSSSSKANKPKGMQLNNLPSLPTHTQEQSDSSKKKTRGVIRMV